MKRILLISSFLVILISPAFVSASTVDELMAQIQTLTQQINQLKTQLTQAQQETTQKWCYDFNKNLGVDSRGEAIKALHMVLGKEGFEIDQDEKSNSDFGESTASAISGFQQKYIDEILKPAGLKYGTGFAGKGTRAKLNQLYGCEVKPPKPPIVCAQYMPPLDNFCTVGKIIYPEKDENGCFRPPKCILPPTDNQPPVIHGVGGPTTLKIGETGTWTIKAYDPENGSLTYDVNWGDTFGSGYAPSTANLPSQTATFTHSYSQAGTYNPTFIVTDNKGLSAKTSISVNVDVTPETISEQVKCLFNGSTTEQKCYSSNNYTCSGKEACVVDVKGAKGEQITWKSSCGGYAYTVMDGNNDYAKFNCVSINPSITVLSPNGGEKWEVGKTYTIQWSSVNASDDAWVGRVALYKGVNFLIDLVPFLSKQPVSGITMWTVPSGSVTGNDFKIQTILYKGAVGSESVLASDFSDAPFSIVAAGTTNSAPKITGGSALPPSIIQPGQAVNFSWTATDPDNDNLGWNINWGDGTGMAHTCPLPISQNTFSSQHTWATAGNYTVKVTVDDCRGGNYDMSLNVAIGSANVPSIKISAVSGNRQPSDSAITVMQGEKITISGTPQGLSGLEYVTGYTRAYIFDSLLNDSCTNNEALPSSPWIMECTAKNIGVGKIYIEIYQSGQAYRSNIINVTITAATGQSTAINQMANILESARLLLNQMLESLKNL
jgi:hypothetical protein